MVAGLQCATPLRKWHFYYIKRALSKQQCLSLYVYMPWFFKKQPKLMRSALLEQMLPDFFRTATQNNALCNVGVHACVFQETSQTNALFITRATVA